MSLAIIAAVGAVVIGGTTAYYSDVETSTGNTFTAGSLDLKIDSTCHYDGMICVDTQTTMGSEWQEEFTGSSVYPALIGESCACTWEAKDLNGDRFFDFKDIKPGDFGENTLSFHVVDNDAYARFKITAIENRENLCTEPERASDQTCVGRWCGELAQEMMVKAWIDEGDQEGWQGIENDPTEGDNILNGAYETVLYDDLLLDPSIANGVCAQMVNTPQADANLTSDWIEVGDILEGNTTYYIGVAWSLPEVVGNEVQSDSMKANFEFEVVQARHNGANPFNVLP